MAGSTGPSLIDPKQDKWEERRAFKRRRERLMMVGFGGLIAAWGLVAVPFRLFPTYSAPLILLLAGLLLAGVNFHAFRRLGMIIRRRPVSIRLSEDGIRATLKDGTELSAGWDDPKLAFNLWVAPGSPAGIPTRFVIDLAIAPAISSGYLTEGGHRAFLQEATKRGLNVVERKLGKSTDATVLYRITAQSLGPGYQADRVS